MAGLDARAQTGELTFKDFLTMSEAFTKLDGKMPGLPGVCRGVHMRPHGPMHVRTRMR